MLHCSLPRSTTSVLLAAAGFFGSVGAAPLSAQEPREFTQIPAVAAAEVRKTVDEDPLASNDPSETNVPADDLLAGGPKPWWIWGRPAAGEQDRVYFKTQFAGGSSEAQLMASGDNRITVWINGKQAASGDDWQTPVKANVQKLLKPGNNEILVEAANEGGPGAMTLMLALKMPDGQRKYVVTNKSWQAADQRDAEQWRAANELARLGDQPWGNVFTNAPQSAAASGSRNVFQVLPGFQVELLYTVPKATQGSWVSLTVDPRGRLLASDQGGGGLYRITPAPVGGDAPTRVEKLKVNMTSAQGMLFAFDSLYVSINGGPGSGLYRLRDTNGDDQFDEVLKLKTLRGGGEHGPHALRLSPDGKSIYLIAGNHTDPPEFDSSRIPSNWSEDLLLPRQWDARGHARGKLAPGGWICKTDPDGKTWEVVSIGYRNPYDMDFNDDGELFAYDADMEWDMGTPWYRPTRLVHATSGSEFGWRSGTGKWPTYYVDSLPPLVNIGPGSPVGVVFGRGARFPAKYQKALYLLDWTFGTIYAIHLQPAGASYSGVKEEFLARTPLPLTDAVVGRDGAFYFTVGGRGAQSELYRVTYTGPADTTLVSGANAQGSELRAIRRKLESLHTKLGASAVETAWPYLAHPDRHIRYAARIAVEQQDLAFWRRRALQEQNPVALVEAMVALARQGDATLSGDVLAALNRVDVAAASESEQLALLRAYALAFIRLGKPDPRTASQIAARLEPFYPAKSNPLNRELCRVLAYLNAPTVIDKTLALMQDDAEQKPADLDELLARNSGYGRAIAEMLSNHPELEKIHYAYALRTLKYGWTLEQRKLFFEWFNRASQRRGGASYEGFIANIRKEAWDNVLPEERAALAAATPPPTPKLEELPKPKGPGRKWSLDELATLAQELNGRDYQHGRTMFAAAQCGSCHRFIGLGGAQGPDLSNVAGRFSAQDLCESIVNPSKVISDQYRASVIETKQGKVLTGRIIGEEDGKLVVETNPLDPNQLGRVAPEEIQSNTPSPVSPMPQDLLNSLNREEVLDLLAYLLSRGNPQDKMFVE